MNTEFSMAERQFTLIRYPEKHQHKSLQAWDSADELLIEHVEAHLEALAASRNEARNEAQDENQTETSSTLGPILILMMTLVPLDVGLRSIILFGFQIRILACDHYKKT